MRSTGELIGGLEHLIAKTAELTDVSAKMEPRAVTESGKRSLAAFKAREAATDAAALAKADLNAKTADYVAGLRVQIESERAATQALRDKADATLAVRGDTRAYQQAIDDAKDALKKNGKTLDDHTAKGRANGAALDALAASVKATTDNTLKSTGSQVKANEVLGQGRQQLINAAVQFGRTKAQATAYADSVLGIPKNWTTKVKAEAAQAQETLRETNRLLAGIHSKTVTVTLATRVFDSGGLLRKGYGGLGQGQGVLKGASGVSFEATAPGQNARTQPAAQPQVSIDSRVFLDGAPFYALVSNTVQDSASRSAWRARTGRR